MERLFLDNTVDDKQEDKSGNWTINTAKSYKLCTSVGNCVFNTHFFRNFQTGDPTQDYMIEKGSNIQYEAFGYAASYNNYPSSKQTDAYVVGDTQNIYIERLTW